MTMDGKETMSEIMTTGRSPKCNTGAVTRRDAGAVVKPPFPNISSTHEHKTKWPAGFWTCLQRPLLLATLAGISPFLSGGRDALQNHRRDTEWSRKSVPSNLTCVLPTPAALPGASAGVSLSPGQACAQQQRTGYTQAIHTQPRSLSQT